MLWQLPSYRLKETEASVAYLRIENSEIRNTSGPKGFGQGTLGVSSPTYRTTMRHIPQGPELQEILTLKELRERTGRM